MTTAELAEHYLSTGRAEGWVHRRLRVILIPTLNSGLTNQKLELLAKLALAAATGAERYSWPGGWAEVPADTVLDVDYLLEYWRGRGITLHRGLEDATGGGAMVTECVMQRTHLKGMQEMTDLLRTTAVAVAEAVMRQQLAGGNDTAAAEVPDVVVRVESQLFALLLPGTHLELVVDAARSLQAAPRIKALATTVMAGIRDQTGSAAYNGLHLRLEKDSGYVEAWGGEEALWTSYFEAMSSVGFTDDTPLYLASGLTTYLNASEFNATVISRFVERQMCSDVLYKELFLSPDDLEGLHSEAHAMLDMLILAESELFVGISISTFSWYIRELRCMEGKALNTTGMIDASRFGHEHEMNWGATFTNHSLPCATAEA